MKEIDDEKVDGLAEQPKNNDINNIADAQEKRKKELEEHGKALKAQREKNMRDVIIDYSDYKELETEDQLLTAFDSQPTIEDKFFIYANLASRNHLIGESINLLTEKERMVVVLYYYEELTLKEISNVLEVSESRVSQLHTKALGKMKTKMGNYLGILSANAI